MADFISLTSAGDGLKARFAVAHIVRYQAWSGGAEIVTTEPLEDGQLGAFTVTETPEQIDALLGVTDRPVIDELAAAVKLVRSIIKDGAEVGFNFQHGDWAERLFASQAVTHRALAKAGASS